MDEDACTTEPAPDEDQRRRVRNTDVEIGAYEILCAGDLDDDGDVDVFDLFVLLGEWGAPVQCSVSSGELAQPSNVTDVFDLYVLLNAWGPCPGGTGSPDSLEEVLEDAGLDMDDWDDFEDAMLNGTADEKENYRCWMEHYLDWHVPGCLYSGSCDICPDDDPYGTAVHGCIP